MAALSFVTNLPSKFQDNFLTTHGPKSKRNRFFNPRTFLFSIFNLVSGTNGEGYDIALSKLSKCFDGDQHDLPPSKDILSEGYRGYPLKEGKETHYLKMHAVKAIDLLSGVFSKILIASEGGYEIKFDDNTTKKSNFKLIFISLMDSLPELFNGKVSEVLDKLKY